jgi:hypothetical protein
MGGMTMTNPNRKWVVWATWCMVLMFGGCGGRTVVPTSYNSFSDDQKMFKIQYPAGWDCDSGGSTDFSRVNFSSGNTMIEVQAEPVTKALLSEIAQTGVLPVSSGDPTNSFSAQKAHWLEKPKFEEQNSVKEEKAVTAETKLGNGVKSEFTGTYSFGGDFRGYRATSMNTDKRIRVVCQCPVEEWESLKPVFDLVIASVSANP